MSLNKQDIIEGLNIADCFTLAMDEEIRHDGLSGNLCGLVVDLDQTPDIELLERRIKQFSESYPLAFASLQQRGKRFYWCQRDNTPQLFFQHHGTEDDLENDFHNLTLNQLINHKQQREKTTPIEFHLITSTTKNTFFIRWIHPFCDARGIDLILKFLSTESADLRLQFDQPNSKALVDIQLDKYRWWQKINLLFKGKRYIHNLDKLQSIIPFNTSQKTVSLNFSVQTLSQEQTRSVLKLARKQVGITGTSLYYIGCFMRALIQLQPDKEGQAYCVPYAFNLRKQRALSPIINNHVCALFAQAPAEIIKDREKLFAHLKQQNTDVIRQKLDYAFLPLMWAGSWLSLDKYGSILRLSSSGLERSSFWFSDVGKLDSPTDGFLGAKINSLFHLSQVTTPPGIAFLCCLYQNQLSISYNYVVPHTNAKQIETLQQLVLAELLKDD